VLGGGREDVDDPAAHRELAARGDHLDAGVGQLDQPHEQGVEVVRVADGQADGTKVICPLHNYAFSVADGTCMNGDFAVRTFPVREVSGELVVDL